MKKFLRIFMCVIICLVLGGSAFALYKSLDFKKNNNPMVEEEESAPEEELPELDVPVNQEDLVVRGMTMRKGAQVFMGEEEDGSTPIRIRFICWVDTSLIDEVESDPNKRIGMMIAPLDAMEAVNTQNLKYIDWINEFDKAGRSVVVQPVSEFVESDTTTKKMYMVLDDVSYENINRKYVAMGVLIDSSTGENIYRYSQFAADSSYRDYARSVAYVAAGSLNGHAMGDYPLADDELLLMEKYMDMAIDNLNGLEEPIFDGSKPQATITQGTSFEIGLDNSWLTKIQVEIEPKGLDIPVHYKSLNMDIVCVTEQGELLARNFGSGKVVAYVAGEPIEISVTVSQYVANV